jgi:UDP-2,4-diacetamido-2,4,6-trideoxy-beta-L-altropyranose hydrolase
MRVAIITEGFHNTGYGHITRCLSIYQAFEERNIFPKLFINGDDKCKAFLGNTRFEIINWLENQDELLKTIFGSDIVVIDSYLAPQNLYEKIVPIVSIPVFIDDNIRLDYPTGVVVNSSINAEQMPYKVKGGTTYLLGPKYIPLRKDFWQTKEKAIKPDIQTILFTFGGQDLRNLTPRLLKLFTRNYPEIKKVVVVGSGFENIEKINEAKDDLTKIYYSPSAAEMFKLMLDSDIAISAAGQTIYELALSGVPTIAIAVAENQKNNLRGWIKEEFLTSEFDFDTINLDNRLQLAFLNYKDQDTRIKIATIGKKKVDGLGAKRIVQALIDQAIAKNAGFYLRYALETDAMNVFNLSNERTVRINSINQSSISWKEHFGWYIKRINDPDYLFLLVFNISDEFMGQIRFDIKDNYAVANISLINKFRGKGLGIHLLISASFRCFNEKPGIEYILGYVKPKNIPSIKSFLGATYVYSHEEILSGEKYSVYKLVRKLVTNNGS